MNKIIASFLFASLAVFFSSCLTDSDEEWSVAKACPESKRGTFTDERDGRVYKYTTIGKQVWMAENLNYKAEGSVCYYKEDDCALMGRVYNFGAAECPSGWRVSTIEDWRKLADVMGGNSVVSKRLKANYSWTSLNPEDQPNGTDDCGFTALYAQNGGSQSGFEMSFATSSVVDESRAYTIVFRSYGLDYTEISNGKGFSSGYVRCLKD